MENKKELFLNELSELSKKYGIYICGCGCCDSPYLKYEEPKFADGEVAWDEKEKRYT